MLQFRIGCLPMTCTRRVVARDGKIVEDRSIKPLHLQKLFVFDIADSDPAI